MTKGEYRVGISFNPSGNFNVDTIKRSAAVLIDLIDALEDHGDGEIKRLKAHAQTVIEDGAMWAVKAATKQPLEDELALARSMDDHNYQQQVEEPKEE